MKRSWWLVVMALACDAEEEALLAALNSGCLLDSDCQAGLVCLFRICHQPCETSEDCPREPDGEHQRCVVADKPRRFCQLTAPCALHSDCPGALLCGIDGECRSACAGDRDCPPGQRCVSATCADPSELVDGGLVATSGRPSEGAPCSYHSDCPAGAGGMTLRCRNGACAACADDRDCGKFERCDAGGCVLIGTPGALYCSPTDPSEKEIACACPDDMSGTQLCKADGSGYEPCTIGTVVCALP